MFLIEKRIYLFFLVFDKRPSENGDEWIEGYILQVEFCLLRLGLFNSEANAANAKAFGFVRNAVYRLLICSESLNPLSDLKRPSESFQMALILNKDKLIQMVAALRQDGAVAVVFRRGNNTVGFHLVNQAGGAVVADAQLALDIGNAGLTRF